MRICLFTAVYGRTYCINEVERQNRVAYRHRTVFANCNQLNCNAKPKYYYMMAEWQAVFVVVRYSEIRYSRLREFFAAVTGVSQNDLAEAFMWKLHMYIRGTYICAPNIQVPM